MQKIIVLFVFVSLYFTSFSLAQKTAEAIIKTKIYCDHCTECGSCQERIIHELKFTKGVKSAELDVPKQEIRVVYFNSKTDLDKIKEAINRAGFDADDQVADVKYSAKLDDCCKKQE